MISRCALQNYKRIALLPTAEWRPEMDALPEQCPHTDCSPGLTCRTAVYDLLAKAYPAARRSEREANR